MKGKELKIKVCGMKDQPNVDAISSLELDYLGNIFFSKSPRNIESRVESSVSKVGVFVKEDVDRIAELISEYELSVVQLHGGESNETCRAVKALNVEVWKVFSIDETFDFNELQNYPDADLFLLDTKTKNHGGAGRKFDWALLERIDKETPKNYFLAGGIGPNDAQEVLSLELKNLIGLDLNSKFEDSPGIKNIESLKKFLKELRD